MSGKKTIPARASGGVPPRNALGGRKAGQGVRKKVDPERQARVREEREALRRMITDGAVECENLDRDQDQGTTGGIARRVFSGTVAFEVADAYDALYGSAKAKLRRDVQALASRLPGLDGEDLLHDAIERLMDGRRRWPDHITLRQAILGTVRSMISEIARHRSQWADQPDSDMPFSEMGERTQVLRRLSPDDPARVIESKRRLAELAKHLESYPVNQKVLLRQAMGWTAQEIRRRLRLTETQYETITRQNRRLLKRFGPSR